MNNKRGENLKDTLSINMSNRVKETDFKALIKSFFGMDNDEESDLSEEEYIKKSNDISEQEKEELLNAVVQSAKLEAMLDYTKGKKTKIERLKVDKNNKDKNKLTMNHINETKRKEKGKEIVDD